MDLESVINYDEVKSAIMEKVVHPSFSIVNSEVEAFVCHMREI